MELVLDGEDTIFTLQSGEILHLTEAPRRGSLLNLNLN